MQGPEFDPQHCKTNQTRKLPSSKSSCHIADNIQPWLFEEGTEKR